MHDLPFAAVKWLFEEGIRRGFPGGLVSLLLCLYFDKGGRVSGSSGMHVVFGTGYGFLIGFCALRLRLCSGFSGGGGRCRSVVEIDCCSLLV